MEKLNVLLVCDPGTSSGFMVTNMGKAAAVGGSDAGIKAGGGSEVENYIEDIDVLMMGSHLAHILDEVEEYTGGLNTKVILMNPDCCSTSNGDKVIDHLLSEME